MTDFHVCYLDAELEMAFSQLFPLGFSGPDVLAEIAPGGWESSPLIATFHPSLSQVYDESRRLHHNLLALRRPDDVLPVPAEPTLGEIAATYREIPVEPDREVRELVGKCLWDIFSDNHDVIAADGRRLDLGSFRASGGFLAELVNRMAATTEYDYLDFYMGTIWLAGRADLTPVYRMLFRRLRTFNLDWVYHFPRLYAVDLRPLQEQAAVKTNGEPVWLGYDPSEAFSQEKSQRDQSEKLAELRGSLDEAHHEALEEASKRPPPATVQAYFSIYSRYPQGWPPTP